MEINDKRLVCVLASSSERNKQISATRMNKNSICDIFVCTRMRACDCDARKPKLMHAASTAPALASFTRTRSCSIQQTHSIPKPPDACWWLKGTSRVSDYNWQLHYAKGHSAQSDLFSGLHIFFSPPFCCYMLQLQGCFFVFGFGED
jgi:hypothetical protein